MSKTISTKNRQQFEEVDESHKALGRINYLGMAIAGALIVLGFVLMLGGSSTMEEFNPDIFSTRRIVVGPCIALIGFVAMGAAIIIHPSRFKKQ